jgi:hypothetical protein
MTNELITTAVADPKKSALEPKLLIVSITFLVFLGFLCGLITLATYNLAHYPELLNAIVWNAITRPTT